jgi:tetratricopeptide (TPR) repeat protein
MAHQVFVSLTHADSKIAEAIRAALDALFRDAVKVYFSTSKELEGGIRSGEDWFQWIVDRVRECDFALILITPSSVNKPWILWEAGAVAGAALASGQGGMRKVRPLVYQVASDLIPSPIRDSKVQFRRGDRVDEVRSLFTEILDDYKSELSTGRFLEVAQGLDAVIKTYLERVQESLMNAPALVSNVVIEEWRLRLDAVMKENRASEVAALHDWMDVSFGRDRDDRPQPIDLRIHTRLADLYLKAKNHRRAIEQLELARQLAPRDIFVLRTMGRAYLDADDGEKAKAVIDRISELDKNAFVRSAECAALLGRWYRKAGDLAKAEEVYATALNADRDSYYLANLIAEVRLEAGRPDVGDAFRRALVIIERLDEKNVWTHATAANAAFFIGEDARAIDHLRAAGALRPDAGSIATIERGLTALAAKIEGGTERVKALLAALRS